MKNKLKNFWIVFCFILKITLIGFGGGNALMPVIKKEAVDKKQWLTLEEFNQMVIVTNMLPGPSVIQSISYICIKHFGKIWGSILTLLAILPHIFIALGCYLLIDKLPINYLYAISVGVLGSIIGVLLAFGWSYLKQSKNKLNTPLWLILFLFTFAFCFFVPAPWNMPIVVMVVIFIIVGFVEWFLYCKSKRQNKKGDK
ncbi:chromate transporter [Mycoplasmopsis iners]|uniref:chromate transporter n=1 Tax=Mycoplasmopsis iners TaxID=76630 RepID=UPI0004969C2D|nr:chromate transporter [Mycoplasmopsis iners]